MDEYRSLKEGEIVVEGDEILHESRGWIPVVGSIGKPAPDPRFWAHRKFRRLNSKAQKVK